MSERPDWKTVSATIGFPTNMSTEFLDDLQRQIEASRDGVAEVLARSLFADHQPMSAPTRRSRLRSWVAWKLWQIAARLEPDVMD